MLEFLSLKVHCKFTAHKKSDKYITNTCRDCQNKSCVVVVVVVHVMHCNYI